MKGLWLYFDVPYADDAKHMRALFGYRDEKNEISVLTIEECKDIPQAVAKTEAEAAKKNISIDSTFTLVIPLDERMGLAWPVREQADNKKWEFSRHSPSAQFPASEKLILYSSFNTGSREMTMEKSIAQQQIQDLNEEAKEGFSGGDMLPVMTALRHAMNLSVQHFGWTHPMAAYTIRNLMYSFSATGNANNEFEGKFLVQQMMSAFKASPPARASWEGSEFLFDHIADNLTNLNEPEMAEAIKNLPMK